MKKTFTEIQPKDGDKILHCGHLDDSTNHYFQVRGGALRFKRPDGTIGHASWIICCDLCFKNTGGDPHKLEIRGDATWQGNEPIIESREES